MGAEDDRWDHSELAERDRVIGDYVRRAKVARGEKEFTPPRQCAICFDSSCRNPNSEFAHK